MGEIVRRAASAAGRATRCERIGARSRSRSPPKEGLALINGTQVSTALALAALFEAEAVFAAALVAGAMSVDAAAGSDTPFDPRIHELRGQPGQIAVAERTAGCSTAARIRESHAANDDRVQDPYCLRCQPQVMGACLDQLHYAAEVLQREANAVTDNPLVFADTRRGPLGRQLPRRAGGVGRRRARRSRWPRSARSPSAASRC